MFKTKGPQYKGGIADGIGRHSRFFFYLFLNVQVYTLELIEPQNHTSTGKSYLLNQRT